MMFPRFDSLPILVFLCLLLLQEIHGLQYCSRFNFHPTHRASRVEFSVLHAVDQQVIDRRQALSTCVISLATVTFLADNSDAIPTDIVETTVSRPTTPMRLVDKYGPILQRASKKAFGGGKAGASAAAVQVCSLMWLRTTMNYQYRYGTTLSEALQTLYTEGGVSRLYQGLPLALIQGPVTRFGDTAANAFVLVLLETS